MLFLQGCVASLVDWAKENLIILCAVGFGVAFVQVSVQYIKDGENLRLVTFWDIKLVEKTWIICFSFLLTNTQNTAYFIPWME